MLQGTEKTETSLSGSSEEEHVYKTEDGDIVVSNTHPELLMAIEKAVQDVTKQPISIPVGDYIKSLQVEMDKIRKERAKFDPTAPQ